MERKLPSLTLLPLREHAAEMGLVFCTVFGDAENFHYQTCPRPSDPESNSSPYQDFLALSVSL